MCPLNQKHGCFSAGPDPFSTLSWAMGEEWRSISTNYLQIILDSLLHFSCDLKYGSKDKVYVGGGIGGVKMDWSWSPKRVSVKDKLWPTEISLETHYIVFHFKLGPGAFFTYGKSEAGALDGRGDFRGHVLCYCVITHLGASVLFLLGLKDERQCKTNSPGHRPPQLQRRQVAGTFLDSRGRSRFQTRREQKHEGRLTIIKHSDLIKTQTLFFFLPH